MSGKMPSAKQMHTVHMDNTHPFLGPLVVGQNCACCTVINLFCYQSQVPQVT